MQSPDYVPGKSGWKIDKEGVMEINGPCGLAAKVDYSHPDFTRVSDVEEHIRSQVLSTALAHELDVRIKEDDSHKWLPFAEEYKIESAKVKSLEEQIREQVLAVLEEQMKPGGMIYKALTN